MHHIYCIYVIIGEILIKTTMGYHIAPVRMPMNKGDKHREGVEKGELLHVVGASVN